MNPFLKQIAEHYIETAEDISRLVFVFPSHRAQVFFRKYLSEAVKRKGSKPVLAPAMLSIDEFLGSLTKRNLADNLTLVLKLYDCYRAICRKRSVDVESLDEFVFWGDVILSDFDDIDKYLINASDLLRNVSDIKNLSDDFSYLSETQEKAIRAFLGHFKKQGEYKLRFARLWNVLGELYSDFNAMLDAENLCYTGKMYRELVDDIAARGAETVLHDVYPHADAVVFCGLNVLCECEKKILSHLRDLSLAQFCWDYNGKWITDAHNKSSLFMKDNLASFPQAFRLEDSGVNPTIKVVSVPSGVGQTKIISRFLESEDVPADERTAIVLPDESMLQPLLNSIPPRVGKVNVTMGYSMAGSSFYTLMNDIAQLQMRLRIKDGNFFFYHRPFWNIVGNNLFEALLDEESKEKLRDVKKMRNYYIDARLFDGFPLLDKVFRPVVSDMKSTSARQIESIAAYQTEILQHIGRCIASDEELKIRFSLELDFAMMYVKSVNLVASKGLEVLPQTYFAMLDNVLRAKAVPIKGEPLTGLQVMGPLETRALDFEQVFVLNCNEGVFPRAEARSSFIPPLLRMAFGLPGREYQDAVWAYYFYRLIQRPSQVGLLLDARSEGMRTGEESRYIKQLRYHFKADITQCVAVASPRAVAQKNFVEKTQEDVDKIRSKALSATAIQNYLACSMKFYYSFVKELRPDDEVSENMDAGIIGNVYHKVMQELYDKRPGNMVDRAYLESVKKDKERVEQLVHKHTMQEMKSDSISGRDIVVCAVIVRYVLKTIERDMQFLDDEKVPAFRIVALERTYPGMICGFRFKGTVDRLDSFHEGMIRVVDYKTGKVLKDDTEIDDSRAKKIADKIFNPDTSSADRPKIALQFFIYDELLAAKDEFKDSIMTNSVYSTRSILRSAPVNVYRNAAFTDAMRENLQTCLAQMVDLTVPFTMKKPEFEDKTCAYCDFKNICGR